MIAEIGGGGANNADIVKSYIVTVQLYLFEQK